MVVQHNLQAMNANRMLNVNTSSQAKSTEKLSSGYKINRAADDAAGLSISEKMRKQIRGLTQASLNAQDGISAVQTAEGALNEVQDMLQRMNELAVKAANGTNSTDDRSYIQDEIDQLITEIDRVAETTKFNETYMLKGNADEKADKLVYNRDNPKVTTIADTTGTTNVTLYDVCGTALSADQAVEMVKNGEKVYKTQTIGFTAASTTDIDKKGDTYVRLNQDLYDKNGDVVLKKGSVITTASFTAGCYYGTADSTKAITSFTNYHDGSSILKEDLYRPDGSVAYTKGQIITDADADRIAKFSKTALTLGDEAVEGTDFKVVERELYDKDGNRIAENGLDSYFKKDGDQYIYQGGLYDSNNKEIAVAGTKLNENTNAAKELKSFIGKRDEVLPGALSFKLHVGADATENNQIQLEIDAMDATTLGIKDVRVDGTDDTNARNTIETVKAAIQKVSTQRAALGAIQNRLEHTINNLDNVVENTTSAESQIRDTDMATEMVKYSNNNILAQAGQAMLAQANQSNQGVLSLLG